jgi:hypothetical protein
MSADLPTWRRDHHQPGGGDAHLFYKVHGTFRGPPEVSRQRHRVAGVPEGCDLQLYARDSHPDVHRIGLGDDWIGRQLRQRDGALARDIEASPQCLVLRGVVVDPESLDYFRDAIGLVTALLESGGVAVFDPHMFKWWSASEWHERAFGPAIAAPRHHVVVLLSDEPDRRSRWFHTRGMIKFGRPNISVHGVTRELEPVVTDLCERFIELQASGAVILEGQPIRMNGIPSGWTCRHGGSLEDPEFNNRHVEIGPSFARGVLH